MVEDIEHFRPKLDLECLMYGGVAMDGKIPLRQSETTKNVAA